MIAATARWLSFSRTHTQRYAPGKATCNMQV